MENHDNSKLEEFKCHMRDVRNSDYHAAFRLIKKDLGLLERAVSDSEIEALLIFATRDCLAESLNADMVLSAFGLLKGFDNQHNPDETKDSDALITARRKMFIEKSSYVADRHGPHNKRRKVYYRSYGELEAAGKAAIDAVIDALGSEDGKQIDKVAKRLYSYKSQISSYLKDARKYLDIDENKNIIGVKLQNLVHVNQDKTLSGGSNTDGNNPKGGAKEKDVSEADKFHGLLKWVCGLVIVLIIILATAFLIFIHILSEKQGQFEVHTTSCYMRLDFSPDNYDRSPIPPNDDRLFNGGPQNSQD